MFELPSLPQELGEIVIQGIRLGRLLYRRLINITTVLAFLGLVPTVLQVWGKGDDVSIDTPSSTDWAVVSAWLQQFWGPRGIVLLAAGLLTLFLQIMLLRRIAAGVQGRKEPAWDEIRQTLRLWPWVIITVALCLLVTSLGFVMLVVPGIILGISLMFCIYPVVLEGAKPLAALNTSYHLVWGQWWRTLVLWLILFLLFPLLLVFLSSALGLGLDEGQTLHARDLFKSAVLEMVLVAFLSPFVFCIQYLYYHDLRLRKQTA